ncbi:MAG: hypothetical protein ACM3Y9_10355 [Ignavibacteria bacterium]
MKRLGLLGVLVAAVMSGGCSIMAPQYSASMENVQRLKDNMPAAAKAGTFTAATDGKTNDAISLRASSMGSPYGTYANYLGEAVKQELQMAGKLNPTTDLQISGVLMKNEIDVSGFGTGYGNIEARFVVKKGDVVRYDQLKSVHSEWESSFAGAVAIPRGRDEYGRLVQRLLAALYADKSFLDSLR